MKAEEFLRAIYNSIEVGAMIQKPTKQSEILEICENGNIYYRIGKKNKKAVTRSELAKVFEILQRRELLASDISEIATSAKPCNVTSIKWLITNAGVVAKTPENTFKRKW